MKTFISVDNSPDRARARPRACNDWPSRLRQIGYRRPRPTTEFNSLITKMKESGADYVYVLGDTPTFVALRKQMDAAGYTPKILYFQRGAQLQEFADAAGDLSNGVTLEAYWLPSMPYPGASDLGAALSTSDTGKTGRPDPRPGVRRRPRS